MPSFAEFSQNCSDAGSEPGLAVKVCSRPSPTSARLSAGWTGRFIQEKLDCPLASRGSQALNSQVRQATRQRLNRARGISVCLLLLLGVGCASQKVAPVPPKPEKPMPARVAAAQEVITRLQTTMMEIMKSGPELGYSGREALIMPIALESYDFTAMASLSYGQGWSKLSVEQQAAWIEIYTKFHVASAAKSRSEYRGQVYQILGYQEVPDGHVLIETQLNYPGRLVDFYTNYLLRLDGGDWKIIDFFAPPSVSVVAMRRAEYRNVLEKSGYQGLVADMEGKMKRWNEK